MASLPIYRSVPADEKAPISPVEDYHPESTGLHLGGKPTLARRARERYSTLSKPKRALVIGGLVWFTLAAAHKTAHLATSHHGFRGHHGGFRAHGHGDLQPFEFGGSRDFDFEGFEGGRRPHHHFEDEELTLVPTNYGESTTVAFLDNEYQSANASFPVRLSRHRHFNLNFEGLEGKVIISRSDIESADTDRHEAEIIVESFWTDMAGDVQMKTGEQTDALTLAASESDAFHTVHLILPANKHRVPSLYLSSTQSLALSIDSSAEDVHFRHLSIRSENGAIDLASVVGGEVELETIAGDVTGSFNVSHALVLKTITGHIDAKVNVVPPFPPPHHKNGSHPHGPPPHHPPHKGEHKPKKHEEHGREFVEEPESFSDVEEQPEERRGCHKAGPTSWWPFRLFSKGPEGPRGPHDKPPHGPKGPKGPHGPHGPGKHHGPPPPVFIGAFSTTGSIKVAIEHQPPFVSSVVKAFSHTGDVNVKAAKTFHGFYEAGTFKGSYEVSVPEEWKNEKVLKEIVGETGGMKKGLVFPKHHNHTRNATDVDFDFPAEVDEQEVTESQVERRHFENNDAEAEFESEFEVDSNESESEDDRRPSPPPGKGKGPGGPGGPGGKRPPPPGKGLKGPGGPPPPGGRPPHGPPPPPGKGKGPGGPPPPPPPPPPGKGHKGPGGPPPPPPGKGHKGPGGPPPPPPPPPPGKGPKGPKGPGGPPPPGGKHPHGPPPPPPPPGKGPKGPGGPPHGPPPPPGHSKILAHTDVGDVKLVL